MSIKHEAIINYCGTDGWIGRGFGSYPKGDGLNTAAVFVQSGTGYECGFANGSGDGIGQRRDHDMPGKDYNEH